MISAFLPETLRKIPAVKVDYLTDEVEERELQITVPNLIMSHTLRKPWVVCSKLETYFSMHALDNKCIADLWVLPYQLANIYPSGLICFGDVAMLGKPNNLRQANNYFWNSPFNDDNCPYLDRHYRDCETRRHDHYDEQRIKELQFARKTLQADDRIKGLLNAEEELSQKCCCCLNECTCTCECNLNEVFFQWLKKYSSRLKQQEFIKSNALFHGERFYTYEKPISALFISNDANLINQYPEAVHQDAQNKFIIGPAKSNNKVWDIDLNGKTLNLGIEEIEVI